MRIPPPLPHPPRAGDKNNGVPKVLADIPAKPPLANRVPVMFAFPDTANSIAPPPPPPPEPRK